MSAGTLKQIIVELTRGGCRVELLAHDPAAITFRSPDGRRYTLLAANGGFRLARDENGPTAMTPIRTFFSLRDALRAACAA